MKFRIFLYVLLTVLLVILLVSTAKYAQNYEASRQAAPDDIIFAKGAIIVLTVPHLILEVEIYHVILYFISVKYKTDTYSTTFNTVEFVLIFGSIGFMYLTYAIAPNNGDGGVMIMLALFCGYVVAKIVHFIVWFREKILLLKKTA